MIQRINRGSDISIILRLKDKIGNPYRVSDISKFIMRFHTKDPSNYIEVSYENETYNGITAKDDADYISLNSSDLDKLEDGILKYEYSIRIPDASFNDGYYNEIVKGQTELYIKSSDCDQL